MAYGTENSSEAFGNKVGDKVEDAMKMGSHALTSATEEISKKYDAARRGLHEASSQVETFVKKNPLIAISASAGIGWALGRLLAPRTPPNRSTHV